MNENLFEALCAFRLDAKPVSCETYGCGHINVTYLAVTERGRRYILQKINNNTFRDGKYHCRHGVPADRNRRPARRSDACKNA